MSVRKHLYVLVTSIAFVATLIVSKKSLKSLIANLNSSSDEEENAIRFGYFGDIEKQNYDNYMPVVRGNIDRNQDGKVVIYLLGLFEFSTGNGRRVEGDSEAKAAELAVKHVNEKDILPGYTLRLLVNDTKVRIFN